MELNQLSPKWSSICGIVVDSRKAFSLAKPIRNVPVVVLIIVPNLRHSLLNIWPLLGLEESRGRSLICVMRNKVTLAGLAIRPPRYDTVCSCAQRRLVGKQRVTIQSPPVWNNHCRIRDAIVSERRNTVLYVSIPVPADGLAGYFRRLHEPGKHNRTIFIAHPPAISAG
jgi:hypothetical protein